MARTYAVPADAVALHSTYGDRYAGTALSAKWTKRNITDGNIVWPKETPSVRLRLDAAGDGIWRTAPSGDFEIVASINTADNWFGMCGIAILDSSGNGVAIAQHDVDNIWVIGSYVYSSNGPGVAAGGNLTPGWYFSLRKTGTDYTGRCSRDGITWGSFSAAHSSAITPALIGFGRFHAGSGAACHIELARFNLFPGPTFFVP